MDLTSEFTIVIPVRIDCKERKENLDAVLFSLLNTTNAFIILLEADTEQHYHREEKSDRLEQIFVQDDNPIFHRTHYLNRLLNLSKTNIVGIWDTDVILPTTQIKKAVIAIKNGITLCYPYNGQCLFLNPEQSDSAKKNIVSFLDNKDFDKMDIFSMGRPSVGGAFVINKERYLKVGGENENLYGWGPEDAERLKRMEILEEPTQRIKGPLFHLYHPRGINSTIGYDERSKRNVQEFVEICKMNSDQLKKYINKWRWKQ
ncbi:galactosyltransferase-related protein [Hoylesella enoeca]|uniref:Galactosyltransferase C-terminal domain-containing protein n=1 Tax=Hoylesella enoeca TaxID=76123 RepID=A0A0S2KKW0_9BACT|nr:galactosyltransferase-related protein [Hoylesella enoeca]ALO48924.1 hypothetical protein AS203_07405 [Hoylesella enoeca]